MMNKSLQVAQGSIADIAQRNHQHIAESFLSCDCLILVDVSGSMRTKDSREGKSRYDVAIEELKKLQNNADGKFGIVAFSDYARFVPAGIPPFMGDGTDVAGALNFIHCADDAEIRFVLISDGFPDDEQGALDAARRFKSRIDCIYAGPAEDEYGGREFLAKLAKASGGQVTTAETAQNMASKVTLLLASKV